MTWHPANNTEICLKNPSSYSCQPSFLTFLAFLTQYVGKPSYKIENVPETSNKYDFIIVGAGSAGCVLANRLSEIKKWKILLLEAGDEQPQITEIPGMVPLAYGSTIDYAYNTQPEPIACRASKNKSCFWPRGKVMGGSSTLNYMWYVRGNKQDYDDWADLGNPGWSYEEVLPYFKKSEDLREPRVLKNSEDSHGIGGYQTVDIYPHHDVNNDIFIKSWKELGLEEIDFNSENQVGVSRLQSTTIDGARQSTNDAFIKPIRGRRRNLIVKSKSQVTKIIIDPKTKTAKGVEYVVGESKKVKRAYAKKEVIISAGAIDSPKLLLLSGIGPEEELIDAGINPIKDLPVGKNLHDHVTMAPAVRIKLNKTSTLKSPEGMTEDVSYWLKTHKGPLSGVGAVDWLAYVQTPYETRKGVPDIELSSMFFASSHCKSPEECGYYPFPYYDTVWIYVALMKPKSRGFLKLNKEDPVWGHPLIQANYLVEPEDLKVLVAGAQIANKMSNTQVFKDNRLNVSRVPMTGCEDFNMNSDEYFECVSKIYTFTAYHPVGTCKMGPKTDPEAVVDYKLRVYDIKRLRVVDASIMPTINRGTTNPPAIMIAEKASDLIKEDWL